MLSKKHLDVIKYYMLGYNKTECLIKAGYSEGSLHSPHTIFNRPDVIKEIENRKKNMIKRNELSEDYVVQKLLEISGADLTDIIEVFEDGGFKFNLNKISPALKTAITGLQSDIISNGRGKDQSKSLRIKVNTADKLRALEMLGKYLGMFVEKVELSGDADLIKRLQAGRERLAKKEDESLSDPNHIDT